MDKDVVLKIKLTDVQWEIVDTMAGPSGEKTKTKRLMWVLKGLVNKELVKREEERIKKEQKRA